jgi:hypothetical protein
MGQAMGCPYRAIIREIVASLTLYSRAMSGSGEIEHTGVVFLGS